MVKQIIYIFVSVLLVTGLAAAQARDRNREDRFFDLRRGTANNLELAIQRVANQMKGKVYRVHLERKGKRFWIFELHAMIGDKAATIEIDARSNQVINATEDGFWAKWTDLDVKKAAQQASISMTAAIDIARKQCPGNALKAKIDLIDNTAYYFVTLVGPQDLCETTIDINTGEVVKTEHKEDNFHK